VVAAFVDNDRVANRSVWNVAIRWAKFPHDEIRADIYSRLNLNAVERSPDDSAQHILRRRLYLLDPGEHRRFIQLESRHIVEHVRCTRDAYRAFTNGQRCHPAAEAYWVILRFAVLPTAIACLRRSALDYLKLTRIWAANLSLLFGIPTRFRLANYTIRERNETDLPLIPIDLEIFEDPAIAFTIH